ncbi:TIGR03067 domain-containing protein [Oleiagrimonas sp. MCCC 1A03011]|uniref:TIGR03067 domain-containing protein n=1 Tax=Oleiagrimonas sp. MCCC 1A03011 TaxID=1926883 RepID=UPI001F0CAAD2|nr:TIGR03067 domain-containing protein [Oleiagrimonas sp. MCCC 1A03011]
MSMNEENKNDHSNASEHDLALLQGEWVQVGVEDNGVIDPPDTYGGAGVITLIDGHRFEARSPDGTLMLHGTFTLDATTTPKSITWVDAIGEEAGQPILASYKLDDDRFVFIAADPGMARPTQFRTTQGLTMRSFVRRD